MSKSWYFIIPMDVQSWYIEYFRTSKKDIHWKSENGRPKVSPSYSPRNVHCTFCGPKMDLVWTSIVILKGHLWICFGRPLDVYVLSGVNISSTQITIEHWKCKVGNKTIIIIIIIFIIIISIFTLSSFYIRNAS